MDRAFADVQANRRQRIHAWGVGILIAVDDAHRATAVRAVERNLLMGHVARRCERSEPLSERISSRYGGESDNDLDDHVQGGRLLAASLHQRERVESEAGERREAAKDTDA